jgi:hypothetical protein
MTQDHSALLAQLDALKSADAGAVFAELIRAGLQALIEAEATAAIGAGRYERTDGRSVHRNGHRPKTVSTTSGDIEVQIPKLRAGRSSRACWSGAAASTSAARRDHGGLRARRVDPQRGRSGGCDGRAGRGLQVGGVTDLRGPGR